MSQSTDEHIRELGRCWVAAELEERRNGFRAAHACDHLCGGPDPPDSVVSVRGPRHSVTLVGLTRPMLPGEVVQVTFVFARAGAVTATVPVAVPTSPDFECRTKHQCRPRIT